MSSEKLYSAFNEIDDDILERSEKRVKRHVKHRVMLIAAAICFAVLLMGAATVGFSGGLQDWIANRWSFTSGNELSTEQMEIIESLSCKINESKTIDGITVTVDSATVYDRTATVLIRVCGMELPKEYDIDGIKLKINGETRGALYDVIKTENNELIIVIKADFEDTEDELIKAELSMTDFIFSRYGVTVTKRDVIAKGTWLFEFDLKRDEFQKISIPDTEIDIANENGETERILLTNIHLTSIGVEFECEIDKNIDIPQKVYLIMTDGSKIEYSNGSGSGESAENINTKQCKMYFEFAAPIEIEDAAAIQIGSSTIQII